MERQRREAEKKKAEAAAYAKLQRGRAVVGKPVRVQFGSEVELPIGWQEVVDAASGKAYFYHAGTNASQWDRPGFIGRVTEFNEDRGRHKVEYTDGDVKWHDLDQRKWSEVSEAEFKRKFGQAVVGKPVRIQWKGGKSYVGRVTEFNEGNGNHKVVYTDGGVKWHALTWTRESGGGA